MQFYHLATLFESPPEKGTFGRINWEPLLPP
jgi:hypothetical protein